MSLRDIKERVGESMRMKKIREGWEKAPMCFCHLLGREERFNKPRLGVPWCQTCGKPKY